MMLNLVCKKRENIFLQDGYDILKGKHSMINLLEKVLNKAKSNYEFTALGEYLNVLRQHNKVLLNRIKRKKLLTMCKSIKKNNKEVLSEWYHIWASFNLNKKVNILAKVLDKVILTSVKNSFYHMNYELKRTKYNELLNGLQYLMHTIDGINMDNQRSCFDVFKKEHCETNPWTERILNIWTNKMKPDYHISFWRLKYEKSEFHGNLSVEQVIKIKKLET